MNSRSWLVWQTTVCAGRSTNNCYVYTSVTVLITVILFWALMPLRRVQALYGSPSRLVRAIRLLILSIDNVLISYCSMPCLARKVNPDTINNVNLLMCYYCGFCLPQTEPPALYFFCFPSGVPLPSQIVRRGRYHYNMCCLRVRLSTASWFALLPLLSVSSPRADLMGGSVCLSSLDIVINQVPVFFMFGVVAVNLFL